MQLSAIDLNLLVVLDALLETESVKAASARVGLSPSATSHALGRLRDLLDDELLVRAGQRLVPTDRARRLRPRVRDALDGVRAALTADDALDPRTLQRAFRIGANDYAELELFGALSARVSAEAPDVDLFTQRLQTDVGQDLRSDRVDLAVGVLGPLPDDVRVEVLYQERFVCLLRRDHPALAAPLTVERYAALRHLLVAPRGVPHGVVDVRLEALGLRRRVARTVSNFLVAPHLVAQSDDVLTVSERIARRLAPGLGLVQCPPPLDLEGFTITMAWHRRSEADPAHRWLRETLRDAVGG